MTAPFLLPCPLCGDEAGFGRTARPGDTCTGESVPFVNCTGCLATVGLLMPDKDATEQDLADQWNARSLPFQVEGIPGLLVLECDHPLTPEQRESIHRGAEGALPPGVKLLVLDAGVKVSRPDTASLTRIEQKVDALFDLIEQPDPEGDPADPTANLDSGNGAHAPPIPTL